MTYDIQCNWTGEVYSVKKKKRPKAFNLIHVKE